MGSGGIIFLIILGVWALYLVPEIVRELSARAQAQAFDRESDSARVLQRQPTRRDSRRVVLTAGRPAVRDDLPPRATGDVAVALRRTARQERRATRLRAVAAAAGAAVLLVAFVLALTTSLPWWSLAVPAGWLGAVLVAGALASARRRRRGSVPVAPARATAARQLARRATSVFDDRQAGATAAPSAAAAAADGPAAVEPTPVATPEVARDTAPVVASGDSWTPVSVPLPTYTAKAVSQHPPALPWSFPPVGPTSAEAAEAAAASAAAVDSPVTRPAAPDQDEHLDERHSAAG